MDGADTQIEEVPTWLEEYETTIDRSLSPPIPINYSASPLVSFRNIPTTINSSDTAPNISNAIPLLNIVASQQSGKLGEGGGEE